MTSKHSVRLFRALCTLAIIVGWLILPLGAEVVTDPDWGYSLDLPAGYQITDQDEDGLAVLFTHSKIPVTVVSKVYPGATDAEGTLRGAMRKLPDRYFDMAAVPYRRGKAAVACFNMTLDGEQEGWAAAVPVLRAVVVVMAYTPVDAQSRKAAMMGDACTDERTRPSVIARPKNSSIPSTVGADGGETDVWKQVIVSVLNSLATDAGSRREAGVMTRFAYPDQGDKKVKLDIGGRTIESTIDNGASDAGDFVVGTEYAVLVLYANDPLYQEAWKRYYRAIFRDALGRVRRAADDVYRALRDDAVASSNEGYFLASNLLAWTQNMTYARGSNAADFTSLPAALCGEGSDCDTRSLLVCAMLDCMGVGSAIFVSPSLHHALFGADVAEADKGQNARLKCGGVNYLLGETTAKGVPMGMVAQEHQDPRRWMGVELE